MEGVKEGIPGMDERCIEYFRFIALLTGDHRKDKEGQEISIKNLNFNVVLSLLKENKMPLAYINNTIGGVHSEFLNFPDFRKEYEKEKELNKRLREEWAGVRGEFLKVGIESMLIKSVGAFPYRSSNLDVLIKQSRRKEAESILRRMGYIQLHNVEEPYKTLFRIFTDGKPNLAIHLHNKVAWLNPFHDEDLLWTRYQRSATDDLIDIPSPEDSILILTAHWFYEDKQLKLSDILNMSSCIKARGLDGGYITSVANKFGWRNGLYFALLVQSLVENKIYGVSSIQEGLLRNMEAALPGWMRAYLKKVSQREISLPFKFPKTFGKSLHFAKTLRDTTATPSQKLYSAYTVAHGALFAFLFYKFKVNIRKQKPMLISISGVDGSGKSTYAKIIYDILNLYELRTKLVWSRVGSSGFLKPFSKAAKILYGWRKGRNSKLDHFQESEARRKDLFKKSSLLRTLGLSMLLLEMLCQYFFKVTLPLFLKKVVICDRYVYDTLVDVTTRYGVNLKSLEGRLFTKILTALTPRPDVAYVLNLRLPDVCDRRELALGEKLLVREQIDLYKKVSSMYDLQLINNDRAVSKISDELIHEILTGYYKKWEGAERN